MSQIRCRCCGYRGESVTRSGVVFESERCPECLQQCEADNLCRGRGAVVETDEARRETTNG